MLSSYSTCASFAVIIPAAGSGSRMGAGIPKVLLPLGDQGERVSQYSILKLVVARLASHPGCSKIVVCAPPAWRERFAEQVREFDMLTLIDGGATRQDSVRLGVESLASDPSFNPNGVVLVHDAARCCVSAGVIDRVLGATVEFGAATAAVRVVDALCRADSAGSIVEPVDRSEVWAIQTPQGFQLGDLLQAHRRAKELGVTALDDAELVRALRPVRVALGDRRNIKVTEPGDIKLAEVFYDG